MVLLELHFPSRIVDMMLSIAAIIIATGVIAKFFWKADPLTAIPTVGPSNSLDAWWSGFSFQKNGPDVIQEGYAKYKHRPFKIVYQWRWLIIISSREHIEEVGRATEDRLSLGEAIRDRMSLDHTTAMGKDVRVNRYHIPIIRSTLTRNIGACPEIKDEIVTSFQDILDLKSDGWASVPALDTIQKVVFRTTNRVFVGLPLCRNPEWMEINLQNAVDVFSGSSFLQHFPKFLKPFIALFMKDPARNCARGLSHLAPIIEERQKCFAEFGDSWSEKPNDLLSWMMEIAEGKESTAKFLTARLMGTVLAAFHTTSHSFAHALFYLAANPQYVQSLREEAEAAVSQEGWSKAALRKMRLIDSFLKENARLRGSSQETLARKAMQDFTFSDGTFIPTGTLISAATGCLHLDEDVYENAATFDPFRFARVQDQEGDMRHQFASTDLGYLPFGHGRYACPGRFFAANVLKTMLAHVVLTYDIKLDKSVCVPESGHVNTSILASPSAKMMFRRRK